MKNSILNKVNLDFKKYFKSPSFEDDMDEFLECLQRFSKNKKDFSGYKNSSERKKAKKDFLKKQIILAFISTAILAVTTAVESGTPNLAGEFVLAAWGTTALIIVISAAGIIIKRVVNGVDDPSFPVVII